MAPEQCILLIEDDDREILRINSELEKLGVSESVIMMRSSTAKRLLKKQSSCDYCNVDFKSMDALDEHQCSKRRRLEPIVACPKCGQQFTTLNGLTVHRTKRSDGCYKSKHLECVECGKVCSNGISLGNHTKDHSLQRLTEQNTMLRSQTLIQEKLLKKDIGSPNLIIMGGSALAMLQDMHLKLLAPVAVILPSAEVSCLGDSECNISDIAHKVLQSPLSIEDLNVLNAFNGKP